MLYMSEAQGPMPRIKNKFLQLVDCESSDMNLGLLLNGTQLPCLFVYVRPQIQSQEIQTLPSMIHYFIIKSMIPYHCSKCNML